MNALRAVPPPGDAGTLDAARADLAPVEEDYTDGAPAYEPATDPEALLLCALMWTHLTGGLPTETRRVAAILTAEDFDDVAHRRLFAVIAHQIAAEQPYDPATIGDALLRSGADGAKDAPLRRRLNEVITAGSDGFTVTHYAEIVLSQSYRRSFHAAGAAITRAAEKLPEDDLFEHMVEQGRRQRAAFNRLNAFRRP